MCIYMFYLKYKFCFEFNLNSHMDTYIQKEE